MFLTSMFSTDDGCSKQYRISCLIDPALSSTNVTSFATKGREGHLKGLVILAAGNARAGVLDNSSRLVRLMQL